MVQVGASGGLGTLNVGFNLGVSLNEIMIIATAITFLLALIPPMINPNGVNVLDFPGSFVSSFNVLWFDNLNFVKMDGNGTCPSALRGINTLFYEKVPGGGGGGGGGAGKIYPVNPNMHLIADLPIPLIMIQMPLLLGATDVTAFLDFIADILRDIIYGLSGIVVFLIKFVVFIGNVLLSCGLGGIRLAIGASIAFYWLSKIIGLLGGITSIFMFIFKIFG